MLNIFRAICIIVAGLGIQACSVQVTSDGGYTTTYATSCASRKGEALYRCAALATGFSVGAARRFDEGCRKFGSQLTLGTATRTGKPLFKCKKAYKQVIVSNSPSQAALDPSSPKALTYGRIPTLSEKAAAQGIKGRGGIKFSEVVVIPSKDVWDKAMARSTSGGATLQVKAIHNGQTIARAYHNKSDGKIALIKGAIPKTTLYSSQRSGDACKLIWDDRGEPIVLRENETGFHRYGFYHFMNDEYTQLRSYEKQVENAQKALRSQQVMLDWIKNGLAKNRSHQNGQCLSVKRRAIPPAPKRIDPKAIERNARGACVNLVGSQFTQEKVIEALESAGRWDITQDYQKWVTGKKMQCAAGVTIDEFETFKTRLPSVFFPNLAKDYFRQAMRTDIDSCIYKVKRRCDDGYSAWAADRISIINEPATLLKQCKIDTQKLKDFNYTPLNKAKAHLAKIINLRNAALEKKKRNDKAALVPFTDKRTYCSG